MVTTDAQVRKLMEELTKHGKLGLAALRAGMDRGTAAKYRDLGHLPSQVPVGRDWRTRPDPFEADWPAMEAMLEKAPELEAKALFEHLLEARPDRYDPGQIRTFQRRVKQWRATKGPPKEVFFAQEHRPGEALQADGTWASELGVTITGEPFEHMLYHSVLPFSNWQWATVCFSESLQAIKNGVQAALFQLGRVPQWLQTDNSGAATHDVPGGKRGFNSDYEAFVEHLGMKPRTIVAGCKEQNGDIESANGALKRRLKQHLLLRGSRDFDSVEQYRQWLEGVLRRANELRQKKVQQELAAMRPLVVSRMPDYVEETVSVTSWSTIRVRSNAYSVPSRLTGEKVRVRVYEDRIEVYYGGERQLVTERLHGRAKHRIDYRHIIWWLLQKPGAFPRYRYRADLFPSLSFRKAYDALVAALPNREADIEYLRLLLLAATTMESQVEQCIDAFMGAGQLPISEDIKAQVAPEQPQVPKLAEPEVDLACYDALLSSQEVSQ